MDRGAKPMFFAMVTVVMLSLNGHAMLAQSADVSSDMLPYQALSAAATSDPGPGIIWKANAGMSDQLTVAPDGYSYTLRYAERYKPENRVLDARDAQGKLAWSRSFEVAFITAPSIAEDGTVRMVMIELANRSAVSILNIDRGGETVWKSTFALNAGSSYWATVPALDADGTAYFALRETWITENYSARSSYSFYRISPSGDLKSLTPFVHSAIPDSTSIFVSGTTYVLNVGNEVYALDLAGNVRWNLTMDYMSVQDIMAISLATGSNGTIFISGGFSLRAIDPTGQPLWVCLLGAYVGQGLAIDENDTAYVHIHNGIFGPERAGVCAVSANGDLLWKIEVGAEPATDLIVDGYRAVIFGSDRFIYSVSRDGELLWSYDAGKMVDTVAMDGKGRLFFKYYDPGSQDSFLVACQGIPRVTWVDWIERNPLLTAALALVSLTSIFLVFKIWKRMHPL